MMSFDTIRDLFHRKCYSACIQKMRELPTKPNDLEKAALRLNEVSGIQLNAVSWKFLIYNNVFVCEAMAIGENPDHVERRCQYAKHLEKFDYIFLKMCQRKLGVINPEVQICIAYNYLWMAWTVINVKNDHLYERVLQLLSHSSGGMTTVGLGSEKRSFNTVGSTMKGSPFYSIILKPDHFVYYKSLSCRIVFVQIYAMCILHHIESCINADYGILINELHRVKDVSANPPTKQDPLFHLFMFEQEFQYDMVEMAIEVCKLYANEQTTIDPYKDSSETELSITTYIKALRNPDVVPPDMPSATNSVILWRTWLLWCLRQQEHDDDLLRVRWESLIKSASIHCSDRKMELLAWSHFSKFIPNEKRLPVLQWIYEKLSSQEEMHCANIHQRVLLVVHGEHEGDLRECLYELARTCYEMERYQSAAKYFRELLKYDLHMKTSVIAVLARPFKQIIYDQVVSEAALAILKAGCFSEAIELCIQFQYLPVTHLIKYEAEESLKPGDRRNQNTLARVHSILLESSKAAPENTLQTLFLARVEREMALKSKEALGPCMYHFKKSLHLNPKSRDTLYHVCSYLLDFVSLEESMRQYEWGICQNNGEKFVGDNWDNLAIKYFLCDKVSDEEINPLINQYYSCMTGGMENENSLPPCDVDVI